MKIAIMGTGMVGQTLASALANQGHRVMIGTRDVAKSVASTEPNAYGMPAFGVWHKGNDEIKVGTFAEAAAWGEVVINASNGAVSLDALTEAKCSEIGNKILIDVANDLDFSKGMPPKSNIHDPPVQPYQNAFRQRFPISV
jgi:8-hydroxy-5-deazaflavin:NADPH oxidoreductase